jgi:hypothetical protein
MLAVVFIVRPELLLFNYQLHVVRATQKLYSRERTYREFLFTKLLAWIGTLGWPIAYVTYAKDYLFQFSTYGGLLAAYVFLVLFSITALYFDYLLSTYEEYVSKFRANSWGILSRRR